MGEIAQFPCVNNAPPLRSSSISRSFSKRRASRLRLRERPRRAERERVLQQAEGCPLNGRMNQRDEDQGIMKI